LYSKGQGVDKDESKAVQLWAAAAAQGLGQAQFNLGITDLTD
jgi:TPR repeat protein